jgi:hypothetical protein
MIEEQLRAINAGQVRNGMTVGPAFATIRDLVVQHGRAYTIQPLPDGEWFRGLQACYANALQAAITGKWVYVEGFAIPAKGDLAVLHAWVTSPKNPLVAHDPTWRHSVQARLRTSNTEASGAPWRSGRLGTRVAPPTRRRPDRRRDVDGRITPPPVKALTISPSQ